MARLVTETLSARRARWSSAPLAGATIPTSTSSSRASPPYGPKVIAVLLSGFGADGVAGLRAVREAGGVTVAQAPTDAAYPMLPTRALEAGVAEHTWPARSSNLEGTSRDAAPPRR